MQLQPTQTSHYAAEIHDGRVTITNLFGAKDEQEARKYANVIASDYRMLTGHAALLVVKRQGEC